MEKEYGIVYVLSNPWMPGLVKIGKTTSTRLKDRMRNLYGTGVPEQFKVEFSCSLGLDEYSEVEAMLHNAFANQRVNKNREFFQIEPERVIPILEYVQKSHKNYRETTSQLQLQIQQYQTEMEEVSAHDGQDGDDVPASAGAENDGNILTVYCYSEKKKVDAVGEFDCTTQKLTIKAGSHISHECTKCLNESYIKQRQRILKDCKDMGTYYILNRDISFAKPTPASTFCMGSSIDGWIVWRSEKNTKENKKAGIVKPLKEMFSINK